MARKHTAQPHKRFLNRFWLWGVITAIVFTLGLIIGTLQKEPVPETRPAASQGSPPVQRDILLYFASLDGQTLIAEEREITGCETDEDCLRTIVQSLVAGPETELAPILPSQATLLNVAILDSLVQLDFSQDLVAAHPGGTQSELLSVYGLVDTLTVNLPHLRQVQILIEGSPVPTLKGHVDLRQPLYPDFSFVEEGEAPIGRLDNLPAGSEE